MLDKQIGLKSQIVSLYKSGRLRCKVGAKYINTQLNRPVHSHNGERQPQSMKNSQLVFIM